MNDFYAHLTSLLVLLGGNFIVGLIPLFIVKTADRFYGRSGCNRIASFLIYFGGSFFMSTCLLILIPNSQEYFEIHAHHKETDESYANEQSGGEGHRGFPIPEFVMLCGFFTTFAIEELVRCIESLFLQGEVTSDLRMRFCSCAKRHTECSRTFKADNPEQTIFGMEKKKHCETNKDCTDEQCSILNREHVATANTNLLQSSKVSHAAPNYGSVANMVERETNQIVSLLTTPIVIAEDGNVTLAKHQHSSLPNADTISNVIVLIVVSFYLVLQGIALGQQIGHESWIAILATGLQQSVVIFTVGSVCLSENGRLLPVICYITTLCSMHSLGIGLTMIFDTAALRMPNLFWGIASASVCGSLLYLTFCDILRRDTIKRSGFEKLAGFILGAVVVASLKYVSVIY